MLLLLLRMVFLLRLSLCPDREFLITIIFGFGFVLEFLFLDEQIHSYFCSSGYVPDEDNFLKLLLDVSI